MGSSTSRSGDASQSQSRLVLGLDIGTTSVGWALLRGSGDPADPEFDAIVAAGVRIFPEGLDESSKESRAVARRNARLRRRQTRRRTQRISRVVAVLASFGWIDCGGGSKAPRGADRHRLLDELDREIAGALPEGAPGSSAAERHRLAQLLPYRLRAEALSRRLTLKELARVCLHLAQRRGFKSNRRADRKDRADAKETETKEKMRQFEAEVAASGLTLGAYLYTLNPHERRIRTIRTTRALYEAEFDAIWAAQAARHPAELTEAKRKELRRALFHQRPLRSSKHLIGRCELEPSRRRALLAYPIAQRFRLLQRVNDLVVSGRRITQDERERILSELSAKPSITIVRLRKVLGLEPDEDVNLGRAGEDKLVGDETGSRMRKAMGSRWDELPPETQERVVEILVSGEDDRATAKRLVALAGLTPEVAMTVAEGVTLGDRRVGLSRAALRKLLPDMEAGLPYATAAKKHYPDRSQTGVPLDRIPILNDRTAPGVMRNPIVRRTVGQVRRVVNAILREHGKPDLVRIEMVRDMKRSAKQRDEAAKSMRAQQKRRDAAKARLRDECGIENPSGRDVEMVLLAEECEFQCVYTGTSFGMSDLLSGRVEIEHIVPLSRSLDDSFTNKTLCLTEENRRKRNRTPFEAYGNMPRWDEILDRVRSFKSDLRQQKLRRFLLEGDDLTDYLAQFRSRQLNDTAYAARVSVDVVAKLYGGPVDAEHRRRVQVLGGGVTAHVRRELQMSAVLGDDRKNRDDFRHHTVDAVAVALTGQATVKRLSDAAEQAHAAGRRKFAKVPPPWPSFADDLQHSIRGVVPSYRPDRRARGQLHEETYYGRRTDERGDPYYVLRTRVESLSAKDVAGIVDPRVRDAVAGKLRELGAADPAKAFADPGNLPRDPRSGNVIRAVRVRYTVKAITVGEGGAARHVKAGSNHHMPIYGVVDAEGKVTRWEAGPVVTKFAAVSGRFPPVPEGRRLLFRLHKGDTLEWSEADGKRALVRVMKLSDGEVQLWPHALATPADLSKHPLRAAHRVRGLQVGETLRRRGALPVTVDLMGRVRRADRGELEHAADR